MKILVLTEKPSVAREIARVLGCTQQHKHHWEGSRYVVTWALGHLVTLAEPEDYNPEYKEWKLADLPMLPDELGLKVIKKTGAQFHGIQQLMRRPDIKELIIATDAGREGELVARWIMAKAKWHKPFQRLWISSQTDGAIKAGFAALKPGRQYNHLYEAAVCRAEADWLVGLNVTRALTCKHNAQLNAGRVQTPTLAMIVAREKEIAAFVPREFWGVRLQFADFFADWRDNNGNSRFFDVSKAQALLAKVEGQPARIARVKREEKSEPPPLAYNLTELQRDANQRFGFSAQKTLSLLQRLYESHKLVTYPRTDSRYLSDDMVETLPDRLRALNAAPYQELAKPLLGRALKPGKRLIDNSKVSDHHAIIPTEQPLAGATLSAEERRIYDLIARRFLAVLYPPHRYRQLQVTVEVAGENFYAAGREELEAGWRSVMMLVSEADGKEDVLPQQRLRSCQEGDSLPAGRGRLQTGKTQPPPRYNDATLLAAMENPGKFIEDEELRASIRQSGLGTVATRADIIEKLLHASYIERQGKALVPTSKGKQLIDLVATELKSPELTAAWEQQLSDIAEGKLDKTEFMAQIRRYAAELVRMTIAETTEYKADNVTKTKCPLCGKFLLLVNGKRGKMLSCPDRNCGHRQPEKEREGSIFRRSKRDAHVNKKLIAAYSDTEAVGNSLGDLLKAALAKQDEK